MPATAETVVPDETRTIKQCRNMHWENLDTLLKMVDQEFDGQGFYHVGPTREVKMLQSGVVRTNCMDCLDRTNVVQSLLARRNILVRTHWCVRYSCFSWTESSNRLGC